MIFFGPVETLTFSGCTRGSTAFPHLLTRGGGTPPAKENCPEDFYRAFF
ncbi:hypothetical protein J2129_002602 [Methanofollis sp. W23]|nr:hypothetical protein [Methanofollis sp. W23]